MRKNITFIVAGVDGGTGETVHVKRTLPFGTNMLHKGLWVLFPDGAAVVVQVSGEVSGKRRVMVFCATAHIADFKPDNGWEEKKRIRSGRDRDVVEHALREYPNLIELST